MSATSSIDPESNWILIQTRYEYMALPIDVAMEVLKHARMVDHSNGKISLSSGDMNLKLATGDQMHVALVKSKMLPKEGE